MKTCIESQFNDCLLLWVLHSRKLNNKMNHTHEIPLSIYILIINHPSMDSLIWHGSFTFHSLATDIQKHSHSEDFQIPSSLHL